MNSNKIISATILSSIFSTQILAEEPSTYLQSGRKIIEKAVTFVAERPLQSAVAAVATLAAGSVAYALAKAQGQQAQVNVGPGAIAAGAAVAHFVNQAHQQLPPIPPHVPAHNPHAPHAHAHHPHGSVAHLDEQQMLALALQRSAQEARPFQELQMGAADYRFNLDLFEVFRTLPTVEERVAYLQELLYNHDQVFMEHDALVAFVLSMEGMSTREIVSAFHKLQAGKWSLLTVVPQVGAIDPEEVPGLNLRHLRQDYRRIRDIRLGNGNLDAAYQAVVQTNRHAVEDAILRLVVRRLFVPAGLSPEDIDRANFALAHLFGDHNPPAEPIAPAVEVPLPAAAQPLVPPQPAPRELTPEELREARLKRLEKKN